MEIRALLRNLITAKALHKVLEWKKEATAKRKAGCCRKAVSYGSCAMGWPGSNAAIVARKEHVGCSDLWLFGAFNECAAAALLSYLQFHLFNSSKEADKSVGKRVEEVMMRAYDQLVRPFGQEQEEEEDLGGFVAAVVIGGERFVATDYGGYKAVLSNGGVATQVGGNPRKPDRARVLLRSLSGKLLRVPGGRNDDQGSDEVKKGAAVVTGSVGSNTEFMVLASDGLWQVMGNQEAVDLVWHVKDPQQAAENLAREAVNRMCKSAVSCIVVRFA